MSLESPIEEQNHPILKEAFLCGLFTSGTPLGGLTDEILKTSLKRLSHSNGKITPVLMDYCSMVSLPIFESYCNEYNIKGIVGTRICVEDNGKPLGEMMFVAKNKNGLQQLASLVTKVNNLPHNVKKIQYTGSDISLGSWVYKTMQYKELDDIGDDVMLISSPTTPELIDNLRAVQSTTVNNIIERVISGCNIGEDNNQQNQIYFHQAAIGDNSNAGLFSDILNVQKTELPYWETNKSRFVNLRIQTLYDISKKVETKPSIRSNTAMYINSISPFSILKKEAMPEADFGINVFNEARDRLRDKLLRNPNLDAKKYNAYLEKEISILKEIDGEGYYQTIIAFSRYLKEHVKETGSVEDLSFIRIRGSASSSLILNLFEVSSPLSDPVEQGLLIERFITPSRVEYPDIDIDMPSDQRSIFIKFLESKFGNNTVAAFINISQKASFQDLLKKVASLDKSSENLSSNYIESLTSRIRNEIEPFDSKDMRFKNVMQKSKILITEQQSNPVLAQSLNHAKEYSELTSGQTSNQSGIIVSPNGNFPLPLLRNKIGGQVLETVKPSKIGFVKFDILCSNNVKFLRESAKLLKSQKGINYKVPTKFDEDFFDFFCKNTSFFIQLRGKGMIRGLEMVKPKNMYELLMSMAIPRPVLTHKDRNTYYQRRNGQIQLPDIEMYQDPRILDILSPSHGFILFDEQILELSLNVAGFNDGQADKLRTSIKKGNMNDFMSLRELFIDGVVHNGGNKNAGVQVFELLQKSVGRYSFCKAHALSYASIAMEQAWFKMRHPDIAISAIIKSFKINSEPKEKDGEKFTEFDMLVNEYKNRGIDLVSPSILHSHRDDYCFIDEESRRLLCAPLSPIFKGTNEKYGKVMLDIMDKMKAKGFLKTITLRTFIDMSSKEFKRILRKEHKITDSTTMSKVFKELVNKLIYFGAFDDVGFMKNTPVSENRLSSRQKLLGISQQYIDDMLSDFPMGRFNEIIAEINPLTLYKDERKIFKTSFFNKSLATKKEMNHSQEQRQEYQNNTNGCIKVPHMRI